jgi:hypothetical protein
VADDLALFTEDEARPDHDLAVVPICKHCRKAGPDVKASDVSLFRGGRKYQHGDPWWPMVAFALLELEAHEASCAERPTP